MVPSPPTLIADQSQPNLLASCTYRASSRQQLVYFSFPAVSSWLRHGYCQSLGVWSWLCLPMCGAALPRGGGDDGHGRQHHHRTQPSALEPDDAGRPGPSISSWPAHRRSAGRETWQAVDRLSKVQPPAMHLPTTTLHDAAISHGNAARSRNASAKT